MWLLLLACGTGSEPVQPPVSEAVRPSAFDPAPIVSGMPPALGSAVPAEPPPPGPAPDDALVEEALRIAGSWVGTPYRWNGRGTDRLPGMDCLGLMFRGYGDASGTPWRRYATDPSELVASGLLGDPVPGVDGVLRAEVDVRRLRRGDVLYLLATWEIPDEPLLVRDGERYWPWHTGLYLGDGRVLHAAPGAAVRSQRLEDLSFDALLATRITP